MRRLLLCGGFIVIIAVFAGIYFVVDPSEAQWAPKCLFHFLTGLQCPGCGLQRAIHALLHGDLAEALRYNTFFVGAIPFIIVALWVEINRKRYPKFYASIHKVWLLSIVGVIIVAWTIIRNIIGI